MSDEKRIIPKSVSRGRVAAHFMRSGESPLEHFRNAPAAVVWRVASCRCRVLQVHLDADGWHIDGDRYKVSLDEWARRMGRDRKSYTDGEWASFAKSRVIEGILATQPHAFDAWILGAFEAGCDHRRGSVEMSDVRDDCATFRATQKSVTRTLVW